MDKQIIFLLDDDEAIQKVTKAYIERILPEVETYIFSTYDELRNHSLLRKVSLFIYDIALENHLDGFEVAKEIAKINAAPVLFMSGLNYNFDAFAHDKITYDFAPKPLDFKAVIHRVKILLKVSKTYYDYKQENAQLQMSLRGVFAHSNLYLLILDKDMVVKLCSVRLAHDLGFDKIEDVEGKSWLEFIPESEKGNILTLNKEVFSDIAVTHREAITPIKLKNGSELLVKWFYSVLKNGHSYTFNIGVQQPASSMVESSIDEIREYWRNLIDENNATLKALKNVIK